jgi:hypothetical protein
VGEILVWRLLGVGALQSKPKVKWMVKERKRGRGKKKRQVKG